MSDASHQPHREPESHPLLRIEIYGPPEVQAAIGPRASGPTPPVHAPPTSADLSRREARESELAELDERVRRKEEDLARYVGQVQAQLAQRG